MKITSIRQQVKRADRYSVYIDGKYSFSLSAAELLQQALITGQELDNQQLSHIQQLATYDKAYMRSLDLLARRPRSVWEMEQYLKQKGYKDNTIKKTINKLIKYDYLNDTKFALAWLSNRRALKHVSKRRISQELQQKRVVGSIITDVLDLDTTNELIVLRDLIDKKKKQTRYQDNKKLTEYLLRQGFNYQDIKACL